MSILAFNLLEYTRVRVRTLRLTFAADCLQPETSFKLFLGQQLYFKIEALADS
jgi:hypothetical protein